MALYRTRVVVRSVSGDRDPARWCCFQKVSATGGVDRMTDTSKYTGSHKERFDDSGKGKGAEGRVDAADNSGYVGNYKGAESYDKDR